MAALEDATHVLTQLSTLQPPSSSRTWQSAPHPSLPLLATACSDKTVRVYSLTSFTLLSTITGGHKRSVRCCAWKPTAAPPTSKDASNPQSHGHTDPILATGSFDASAAIWVGHSSSHNHSSDDAEDAQEEDDYHFAVVLEGHDSEIKSLAWSPSGTYLATCSRDKSVWIWESLSAADAEFGYSGPRGFQGDDDEDNYETVAVLQEHDGDVKCVAWHPSEETCLASASYDECVRVWREDQADGEWGCVAVLEGHKGTVWCVDWEGQKEKADEEGQQQRRDQVDPAVEEAEEGNTDSTAVSGPRLVTCSDDLSIRIWRRKPKVPKPAPSGGPRIPSSIRSNDQEEQWHEEARLPQRHERAIYAVAWSKKTGRVVSAGSDGQVVVYEEVASDSSNADVVMGNGQEPNGELSTHWVAVAEVEGAHGVFEINHVCWAKRWDRARRNEEEEVIVTTGDDGEVKVWTLDTI